jgi:hypothetical protein
VRGQASQLLGQLGRADRRFTLEAKGMPVSIEVQLKDVDMT